MSTTPIHDELVLSALDLDLELPCEHPECSGQAAEVLVVLKCCGSGGYTCAPCLDGDVLWFTTQTAGVLECDFCHSSKLLPLLHSDFYSTFPLNKEK